MLAITRRLFVYGTMLQGERDHALVATLERRGVAKTEASFHLVDLGAYAALVPGGSIAVAGEIYALDRATLATIDVLRQVPLLFKRVRIHLDGDDLAESYVMEPEQVRGRRRLEHGDWRRRFAAGPRPIESPFARWAKGRHDDK